METRLESLIFGNNSYEIVKFIGTGAHWSHQFKFAKNQLTPIQHSQTGIDGDKFLAR